MTRLRSGFLTKVAIPPGCCRTCSPRRSGPWHLLPVDCTMRMNASLTPVGLGAKTPAFQHKSLSLGNSPAWLPRAGAHPFPIPRHLPLGQLHWNDLQPHGVFQQEAEKCLIPWNTNCSNLHGERPLVTFCRHACLGPQSSTHTL